MFERLYQLLRTEQQPGEEADQRKDQDGEDPDYLDARRGAALNHLDHGPNVEGQDDQTKDSPNFDTHFSRLDDGTQSGNYVVNLFSLRIRYRMDPLSKWTWKQP